MSYRLVGFLFFSVSMATLVRGQAEGPPHDSTAGPIRVSLSASIDPKNVPLNRDVLLKIEISWEGNLDQVAIGQVTEPVLSNLDIVGTTASNRVLALASGQRAIKEVAYTLKPKALGMAYVEPVTLSYEDRSSHQIENLKTQRLSVEVISAVPEDRTGVPVGVYWILGSLAVIFGAAGLIAIWLARRSRPSVQNESVILLEERYLNELCADGGPLAESTAEGFSKLSRLFRRYLAARYGLAALEITTEELVAELPQCGLPEDLVSRCATLLTTADVVKFSGQEVAPAEYQLAYTTVETLFEQNLAENRRGVEAEQARAKKRNKS